MTRKITKSNQSEQRSDRGAKRSDRGGAYSGAPAYTLMVQCRIVLLVVLDVYVFSLSLKL